VVGVQRLRRAPPGKRELSVESNPRRRSRMSRARLRKLHPSCWNGRGEIEGVTGGRVKRGRVPEVVRGASAGPRARREASNAADRREPQGAAMRCARRSCGHRSASRNPNGVPRKSTSLVNRVLSGGSCSAAEQCAVADVAWVGAGKRRGRTEEWRLRLRSASARRHVPVGALCRSSAPARPLK